MIVIEVFFAIFKATIEAGMELVSKSFLWGIGVLLGFAMLVGWPFVGAYYPFSQFAVYTKYLCGVYVFFMIAVVVTWFRWWNAGKKVFDIDWDGE